VLLAAATVAGTPAAQDVGDPCKNHYILSIDGKPYEDTKCQVEAIPTSQPPGDPPTLRITQVYSTMDGSTQYVELTEYAGRDDQNHIAGWTLTSASGGIARTWVFPHDLPDARTANASYVVAVSMYADPMTSAPMLFHLTGCCVGFRDADFAMPERFLSVEGGTLSFAGVDTWNYPPLPTDGSHALYRDGSIGLTIVRGELHCSDPSAAGTGSKLCSGDITVTAPLVRAVEFRNVFNDQRFVTAAADAIETIDHGMSPGWVRSGLKFRVAAGAVTFLGLEYTYYGSPVCRYRIPTADGVGYFYSLARDECAAAALAPGAVLETDAAFYAQAPASTTGTCPSLSGFLDGDLLLTPVYRVASPVSPFVTRLTTDVQTRDALVAAGWERSGFGPDGTAMCVF
jgi:hypothetical protein